MKALAAQFGAGGGGAGGGGSPDLNALAAKCGASGEGSADCNALGAQFVGVCGGDRSCIRMMAIAAVLMAGMEAKTPTVPQTATAQPSQPAVPQGDTPGK